ncbi:MAG: hypothetical protein JST40_10665 [Armatimonadetes bacterium]|nr:hypothetical protein [Armatimonadota bacterium]
MLRGHVLLPESAIGEQSSEAIVLNDAVAINSSQYVLVTSGHGENGWTMSRDGAQVYKVYLNRNNSFWSQFEGTVHVLSIHHSWSERKEAVLVS